MTEKCFVDFLRTKRFQNGSKYEARAMQQITAKVHGEINVF